MPVKFWHTSLRFWFFPSYIITTVIIFYTYHFFRCSSPSKLIGPRNVYNVSSATLTSYTSYSDGDSLDASLPNHLGLPVVKQKKSKTSLGTRAREKKILASIRNFLIVLALSIHSVFEGMAIGKDNNNFLTSFVLTSFSWVPVCKSLVFTSEKKTHQIYESILHMLNLVSIRNFPTSFWQVFLDFRLRYFKKRLVKCIRKHVI